MLKKDKLTMKLITLCLCILLSTSHAAQAIRCMKSKVEIVNRHENKESEVKPHFIDCGSILFKPVCYHKRITKIENDRIVTTITKGCSIIISEACDGNEEFCNLCFHDACNSAMRFAAAWKILYLTIFALVYFFAKHN